MSPSFSRALSFCLSFAPISVVPGCGDASGGAEVTGQTDTSVVLADGEVVDAGSDVDVPADPFVVPASVPREGLEETFGRARCAFDEHCEVGYAGTEPSICIEYAGRRSWMVEAINQMEARGDYDYDPGAMGECLQALAARPCDRVPEMATLGLRQGEDGRDYFLNLADPDWLRFAACRKALLTSATTDGNSPCMEGVECASGRCFENQGVNGEGACGVCAETGATCADSSVCGRSERCDSASGRCVAAVDLGGACTEKRDCLPGLRCDDSMMCAPLVQAGGECDDEEPCHIGLVCDESVCVEQPFVLYGVEGAECGHRAAECRSDLDCDYDADRPTCVKRKLVGLGASCYDARCEGDLVCNGRDVCALPLGEGERCLSREDCEEGLYCADSKCVPRLGEGEACGAFPSGERCAEPLSCVGATVFGGDDGTCALGGLPDAPCVESEDCRSGLDCDYDGDFCYVGGTMFFGCR